MESSTAPQPPDHEIAPDHEIVAPVDQQADAPVAPEAFGEAPSAAEPPTAERAPVRVDQYTRRSDHDVLQGHFGRIESGEYGGRVGVFETVATSGPDGYPATVSVKLRDSGEVVICDYADLAPTPYGGR